MVRCFAGLLTLIATALLCLPAHAQTAVPAGPDWVTHRPEGAGFSIQAPPGWRERQSRRANVQLVIAAPILREGINANCNVGAGARNITAEEARDLNAGVQDEAFWRRVVGQRTEITILDRRLERVNGVPAHLAIATRTAGNAETQVFLTMANMVMFREGWALFAVCAAGARTRNEADEAWNTIGPTIRAILGSLVLDGR